MPFNYRKLTVCVTNSALATPETERFQNQGQTTFVANISGAGNLFCQRSSQHDDRHASLVSWRTWRQQNHATPDRQITLASTFVHSFKTNFVSLVSIDSRVAMRNLFKVLQALS